MSQKSVGWVLPFLAAMAVVPRAQAGNPFVELPTDYAETPAHHYASMDDGTCMEALDERAIPYEGGTAGALVEAPVQIAGPVRGITFTHIHPRASGAVLDCRLLLAVNDFAGLLGSHGVTEVGYRAAYRPDASGKAKPGRRHPAGLAMDIVWFRMDGDDKLVVERDYDAQLGAHTCGRRGPVPRGERAAALHDIVCDTASARFFHLFLTPNYNRDHHDHVHVEVRRNIRWFLVQ